MEQHPIGVVSARTGLPQDVIRAWERRYGAVTPSRTGTGRRLYSDEDIERLRLLRRAVAGGRRISEVAKLSLEVLRRLVTDDRSDAGTTDALGSMPAAGEPAALLEEAFSALEALDRHRLAGVLDEASVRMSAPALRNELLTPLLDRIGERWQEGSLRIVHEHLASTLVRSFLTSSRNGHNLTRAPRLIVTTPAGQYHELGALMAALVAEEAGFDVYYLGANLPAEEIASAVRELRARGVALSVNFRDSEGNLIDEMRRLRRIVDARVPIFVGGRAVEPVRARLMETGVTCPGDLNAFRTAIDLILAS